MTALNDDNRSDYLKHINNNWTPEKSETVAGSLSPVMMLMLLLFSPSRFPAIVFVSETHKTLKLQDVTFTKIHLCIYLLCCHVVSQRIREKKNQDSPTTISV